MPVWSTEIMMQLCHFLSLFFFSNTLTENWDVFQLHTESTDYCSFLPSASCWSTLIETSGKVITHCQPPLRVPWASESPKEETGGRKHHPIPTLELFNKSLEYTGLIKKVSMYMSESRFLKKPSNPPELFTQSCREPQKFGMLWFTPRKCRLIFKRFWCQALEHFPVEQVLFVLGTLEPAFLGPEVSIISFSGDTTTLLFFPWAFSLRAFLKYY